MFLFAFFLWINKRGVVQLEFYLTFKNGTIDLEEVIEQLEKNNIDTTPLKEILEEST